MFRVLWFFLNKRSVLANAGMKAGMKAKALAVFALLLWYATSGFLFFELPGKPDLNWLDALWWSLVTMATVGYGDLFPVTAGGRYLVGVPTMIFGIGFLGYIISEIAGSLIESRSRRLRGMEDITSKGHLLIINFNHVETALKLVRELKADTSTRHKEICILDETLGELPPELLTHGVQFLKGDPTRLETLRRANIQEASHAIILTKDPGNPHSDDQNLVATLVIESLNAKIFTVVEIIDAQKIKQVEMAGANSVICASELTSSLIVQELQDPGIKNIIQDLTSDTQGHQIYFVPIQKMITWDYAELVRWGLAHRFTVIGLSREGRELLNCEATERILKSDRAILIGKERIKSVEVTGA